LFHSAQNVSHRPAARKSHHTALTTLFLLRSRNATTTKLSLVSACFLPLRDVPPPKNFLPPFSSSLSVLHGPLPETTACSRFFFLPKRHTPTTNIYTRHRKKRRATQAGRLNSQDKRGAKKRNKKKRRAGERRHSSARSLISPSSSFPPAPHPCRPSSCPPRWPLARRASVSGTAASCSPQPWVPFGA